MDLIYVFSYGMCLTKVIYIELIAFIRISKKTYTHNKETIVSL